MTNQYYLPPALQDEIIGLTQDLVRQKSLPGQEQGAAQIVEAKMRTMDFDEVYVDPYGCVVGIREGGQPGGRTLFDAHLDVVPAQNSDDWSVDPFGGELREGRIWGRGSTDIKGGLAAMLVTLGRLPRETIPGTLILSASVGEELVEGAALKNVIEKTHPSGVVIIEPTECRLGIGQKGRMGFWIRVKGKPAHTSNPELGENAIYKAMEITQQLKRIPMPVDAQLGKGIMELTEISSTPSPGESIVPFGCSLRFERRLVSGENQDSVRLSIDQALTDVDGWQLEINESGYTTYTREEVHYPEYHPGWTIDRNSAWVTKAVEGLTKANLAAEYTTVKYCTNGSYPAGILKLPTVIFGPSTIKLAHAIDEYIEVSELFRAAQGLLGLGSCLGEFTRG